MTKFKRSYLKGAVALLLCFTLLFSAVPALATETEKSYVTLYDEEKVSSEIFADNVTYNENYPDGVVLFPVVNAELKMGELYSFELYRMGGADGEATVTLETVDFTAGYGINYEIYLSNKSTENAVDGEAALMYATEEYSYIPVITSSDTQVEGEDTDPTDSAQEVLASLSADMQDLITPSSSFTVKFAPGESKKKIFIRTIKDDTITADLEFVINLKDAEGCEIGSQNSAGFTIKEEREKPETQLTIADTEVNPDSEQAYVIVSRGGNLGTYGSFRVVTESDTATAGEDYVPVQMQLDFLPGMSEQKIAIDILDTAKSGEKFKVKLENVKNANVINSTATVTFTDKVDAEKKHETVMSGANSPEKSTQRDLMYIPISEFSKCTTTDRGTGSQKAKFTLLYNDAKLCGAELYYSNGVASKNNAISIRTNDKIDFTGVDKVSMSIDNYTGSCKWDHNAIYIADSDKFSSETGDYDWLNSLDDDGVGKSWDMTNVSQAPLLRETDTLSESKINGEHYLYIMLHKGGFAGECAFKIFSEGNTTNNVLLHLKEYNIEIVEPDEVQLYRDGVLSDDIKPVDSMEITDPADGSRKTSTKIYRDETVSIIGNIMSGSGNKDAQELADIIKLTSVVFCDPKDTSKVSEPVSIGDNGTFTLTSDIIEEYGSFFKDNKIIIKPIYSIDTAEVNFGEYDCNGQQVKFNSDGCSAQVYSDNVNIGTLSWTKSERDGGKYLIGDELKFTFTSNGAIDDAFVDLDYRSGATKSMAELERYDTHTSTTNSTVFTINDAYTDIIPYITVSDPGVMIHITNPDYGSVVGATEEFSLKNPDGSLTISGYVKDDKSKVDFEDLTYGNVLSVYATPKDGYRAKWECLDASTGEQKVYYGNSFFFAVQYGLNGTENNVMLTFEKIDTSKQKQYYVNGNVSIQHGSVLNPANASTEIYDIMPTASVTIGNYMALSDANGEFYLETAPTMENSQRAKLAFQGDETIRALVMKNNQYYITDVKVSDFINTDTTDTLTFSLKLDYVTYGPTPESITATNSQNQTCGAAIPLVTAEPLQFDLYLNLDRQDQNKPVNMVRWTIESVDGAFEKYDDKLEDGSTKSHYANILSEIARPGMSMYVELFNVTTNSSGDNVYTTYGKFDTGYSFIATADKDTVTYAPDIGVPSTMALPAPCIGPLNPTCSLFGLSPVFNIGSAGTDEQGREMKTVTIGLSFAKLKNFADKDSSFASASPLDKGEKMLKILDNYDKCLNETGTLPKFAKGKGLENALNMKTAIKLNISVALCFQGNYYVDNKTGEWMFVSEVLIIGFGGSFSVSIPFTFFYIPCFTYITVALQTNIYVGIFPKTDGETGSTVALTLKQLDDAELSEIQGVYEIKGSLTFGLGVGFDGLVSASGSLTTTLDIQFNDFLTGVGNLGMSGGVTVELLFFKYTWSESFLKVQLFNTLNDINSMKSGSSAFTQDVMNNVTLGDMHLETGADSGELKLRSAVKTGEAVIADSSALVKPSICNIGNDRYLITAVIAGEGQRFEGRSKNMLYYMIYDAASETVVEEDFVLSKLVRDLTDKGLTTLPASQQLENLDADVQMTDCGDDILLTWTKLRNKITEDSDNLDIMKSIGIASIYYNKAGGYFHDYSMTASDNENEIYINPRTAYNSKTGLTQLFYEVMNIEGVSLDTTVSEFQQLPTKLATRYVDSNADLRSWSDENIIALSENALNYYTVDSINDKIVLAFVGSAKKGFTLEDVSNFEYDDTFDASDFGTENSLYIQQFSLKDDKLESSQQVRITDDGYVSANPEFAQINSNDINNLLLFYKCNGLYAYQNINTLISQGIYTDENGVMRLQEDYIIPQFITSDEDHTVNDDFMIVSDDKNIYALWTTTEGTQQQIWARSFSINGVEEIQGRPVRDSEGNVLYDADGNVLLDKFDEPIYLLKGSWGGKTYLTEGGVGGTDSGMYKKDFDSVVTNDGNLLTVFNAFDIDYQSDEFSMKNNKIVVAEYNPESEYVMSDAVNDIMFSNSYPTPGETIEIESIIKNKGVLNGNNVTAQLYVNGEIYAENTYDKWLTAESKHVEFEYIMPYNVKAENVEMYVQLVENGETKLRTDSYSLKSGDSLAIQDMYFLPVKNVDSQSDTVAYRVVASVKNIGNEDYISGKYMRIMETDIRNMTASMNEENQNKNLDVYTMYGTTELKNIDVGKVKQISFITDEIPREVFEKSAGAVSAYLEGIITDGSQLDKTVFGANDKITILSQTFPGMTMLAQADVVESIVLSDLSLAEGNSAKLEKVISPASSQLNNEIKYTSSDESVAVVDNLGVVTAIKEGSCTISAEANGVKSMATVTVTEKAVEEPTESPTAPTENTDPSADEPTSTNPTEPTTSTVTEPDTQSKNESGNFATGVMDNLWVLAVLAFISLAAVVCVNLYRKKKKDE